MSEPEPLEFIDEYYLNATTQEQDQYTRGQVYWCPCLYFEHEITVLYPRAFDPYGKKPPLFETLRISARKFNEEPHEPLQKPKLEADEEFMVLTAKRRPVVLLSCQSEPWKHRSGKTREECSLVAPMYSFEEADTLEWRLRIRALAYRELFYLPADEKLRMSEGFIRFDRVHVAPRAWLTRKHVCLHPDALYMLAQWFQYYLTDTTDDFILDYRDLSLKQLEQAFGAPN